MTGLKCGDFQIGSVVRRLTNYLYPLYGEIVKGDLGIVVEINTYNIKIRYLKGPILETNIGVAENNLEVVKND